MPDPSRPRPQPQVAASSRHATVLRSADPGLALITGASSGIGAAIARELGRRGHPLALVGRDRARLDDSAECIARESAVAVHVVALDLCESGAAECVFAELGRAGIGPPEILVNSAGFGSLGPFATASPDEIDAMIQLDVASLVRLTRFALPAMLQRGRGRVLNVASTAAFQPGPFMATYYASKAFVLSFSAALWSELQGSGVTVTALCPGPVRTGFQSRAGMDGLPVTQGPLVVDVEVVARAGVRAMLRGQRRVVPGVLNRAAISVSRWMPQSLILRLVRRMQRGR